MKIEKNPKVSLQLRYRKALELGFIGALCIVIFAFQVLRHDLSYELKVEGVDVEIEVEEIPPTEQIMRPPAPPRPAVPVPTEAEEIPEEETIEATDFDLMSTPLPPPPEISEKDASDVYQFIPYDEPPEMIGGMAALLSVLEYPEIARKAGMEARVIIGVYVDEKGKTIKTQVLQPSGAKLGFEEAASAALMKMKWKPAYQRDRPVAVWISVPVSFKLRDPATKSPST